MALPLTYFLFPLRPFGLAESGLVHWAAMGGVAAVILHRGYEATSSAVQARTRGAYQALFRDRAVRKHYEAVAAHRPELDFPRQHASRLQADPERFFISRELPGAPNSLTEMRRLRVLGPHALYGLQPVTGQRHQLRLHMAALGLPILGDAFYPEVRHAPGVDDWQRPLQLLARAIAFTDPLTGQARQFESRLQLAAAQGHWPD